MLEITKPGWWDRVGEAWRYCVACMGRTEHEKRNGEWVCKQCEQKGKEHVRTELRTHQQLS